MTTAIEPMLPPEVVDDTASIFWALRRKLEFTRVESAALNDYYEGDQKLEQLGLAIPPELQQFSVILNWPRIVVDGCEQRLNVVGFRLGNGRPDDYLGQLWQYNDLDEHQSLAHIDALALGRSYLCLGTNEEDPEFPIITVESPLEVTTIRDPRTRRIEAGLRLYGEESDGMMTQQTADMNPTRATLYLPDVTYWLTLEGGKWELADDPDVHRLGVCPIVPLINRGRATMRRRAYAEGVSEMNDIIPIAESASRAITNGQLAQETHAVPHRVFLGATKADFVRADGSQAGAFETYMSGLTALSNANGKAVQFDASDLSNFETMVNVYARAASGLAGMPIEYFGLNTQNPPSAEGQRAGETRLIAKSERKQTGFGHAWEKAAQIALRMRGADDSIDLRSIEAIWRDAGTPTIAQQTDAITKRYAAGLIDWETAQEKLGETPAAIELMKTRRMNDLTLDTSVAVQAAITGSMAGQLSETAAITSGHDAGEEAAAGEQQPPAGTQAPSAP